MANRATLINEKLDNIVECCICIEPLTDPRILPCFHTFCVGCLKEIGLKARKGPGDKMPCPQCRAEFSVPLLGFMGLQKNFFMDKLLEVIHLSSKQNVCDFSTGNCSSVKWYCKECMKMFCDRCSKLHKTQKDHDCIRFEDHTGTLKHLDISQPKFCEQHEKEKMKIFCTDCHVVLCTFCFLESHQPHKWSKVKEAAKMVRTNMIRDVDLLLSSVSKIRDITEENNIALLDSTKKIESSVKLKKLQVKALLEKILDEDESSLLEKLTALTRTMSTQIEMKKGEIDEHETRLNSYIMSCNDIAANGSDVDICRAASELDQRAKELKDLLGIEMDRKPTKFHISFEEKKSEDFLKSRLGSWLGEIDACSEQRTSGNDLDEKAANPKSKNAIAIIDPNTGQNVLKCLEINSIEIKNEFARKVSQRISLGEEAVNLNSEKSAQPFNGARPKSLWTPGLAASRLDENQNVEESTIKEKSQDSVQVNIKEKFQDMVRERWQGNIQEKRRQDQVQESTRELIPIVKQSQVEKVDAEKSNLATEQPRLWQAMSEEAPNVGECEAKAYATHASKPTATWIEKSEYNKPMKRTANSNRCEEYNAGRNTSLNTRGIIMYDREFLLQFRYVPESLKIPLGFPTDFPEIVRGLLTERDIQGQTNYVPYPCFNSTPNSVSQTLHVNPTSAKRDGSQKRNKANAGWKLH